MRHSVSMEKNIFVILVCGLALTLSTLQAQDMRIRRGEKITNQYPVPYESETS